jgi:hypothetical protein
MNEGRKKRRNARTRRRVLDGGNNGMDARRCEAGKVSAEGRTNAKGYDIDLNGSMIDAK